MHRTRFFTAIILIIGATAISVISFKEGWLTNLTEYATLVISGIVVIMLGGAGTLLYKSFQKAETQLEVKPLQPLNEPVAYSHSKKVETFETDLSPKQGLHLGSIVNFKATVKGKLTYATIQAEITLPNGEILTAPCYETIDRNPSWFTKGKLNGPINRTFEWQWEIPKSVPIGERIFLIRVYESIPHSRWARFNLHILLWLKAHLISSIDLKVLDHTNWVPICDEPQDVIISA